MAKPRETTVRRVPEYMGPDKDIGVETLDSYECEGGWCIQRKIDGMWAFLRIGHPEGSWANMLKSRDARTSEVADCYAGDLRELVLPWPEGTTVVGELESGTEWSQAQVEKNGFRRMHLFDVITIGEEDLRDLAYEERFGRLMQLTAQINDEEAFARLPMVTMYFDEFRVRWLKWIEEGYEGAVIKRLDSTYHTKRLSGKTDQWLRCKKLVSEDFVLCGLGMTKGGKYSEPKLTGKWGLYKDGELKQVMQGGGAPPELLIPENIGKLVAEFQGKDQFKSGYVRHAHFLRVRTDKAPEDCVLR